MFFTKFNTSSLNLAQIKPFQLDFNTESEEWTPRNLKPGQIDATISAGRVMVPVHIQALDISLQKEKNQTSNWKKNK